MSSLPSTPAPAAPGPLSPPAGRGGAYAAILSLPRTGLSDPARLRGRRLAVPRTEPAAARALGGFEVALERAGLALADVDLVPVEPHPLDQRWSGSGRWDVEANALLRGEVDAVYVSGVPGLEIAEAIGARVVVELHATPRH